MNCQQCIDFGDTRPATCSAAYLPASLTEPSTRREFLCDSCAGNPRIYCDIRPLPTAGISLAKPSDAPQGPRSYPTLTPTTTPRAYRRNKARGKIA